MESIKAKTLYTGDRVIQNAWLMFEDGIIKGISDNPNGPVIGEYDVVTPAFIDPHSHIGMVRAGEPNAEAESNDRRDPLLFMADALDSLQMDDMALKDAIEMGVLYSCIVPGSGNIIGGRSAVIRHYANDSSHALITRAGIKSAFGYNPMSTTEWKGSRPTTRMGAVSLLRNKIEEVRRKGQQIDRLDENEKRKIVFSPEEDVLLELLAGKTVLRTHVHKIDDIAALIRLADEFGLRVTVDHAMGVHGPEIFRELKQRDIPVIYGPIDGFAYKVELKQETWRNIRHLIDSGVEFGLMTDHPVTASRQLLLQTRWFMRFGYTRQAAIELVSRKNAMILGIADRLGTLEPGKWASFTCWNGDPFDLASYPTAVYGEGRLLHKED